MVGEMEKHLKELLQLIKGEGRFYVLGSGLHTYPNGDENNKKIFARCLELEQKDLIYRKIDEPSFVLWVAKEEETLTTKN